MKGPTGEFGVDLTQKGLLFPLSVISLPWSWQKTDHYAVDTLFLLYDINCFS